MTIDELYIYELLKHCLCDIEYDIPCCGRVVISDSYVVVVSGFY